MNATVIMAVQDTDKAAKVCADILQTYPKGDVIIKSGLDLGKMESVKSFVKSIENIHLNGIINNAGMQTLEHKATVDGFETIFAKNHLGPFLLTN